MDWKPWQQEIDNCKVIITYDKNHQLYPISDWLHPGLIPIGNGDFDELYQDLPNLEWFLRHLGWLGFYNVDVSSSERLRGLDLINETISKPMNLRFLVDDWIDEIINMSESVENIILVSGLYLTNSDLRKAVLHHCQLGNSATLLAVRGLQFQVGLVTFDEETNLISDFQEKPIDKTQLVNSKILILNLKNEYSKDLLMEFREYIQKISNLNNQLNQSIINIDCTNELIQFLIKKDMLSTIELTGVKGEPWFLDLSKIETWIKLDPQFFIQNFKHLFNCENFILSAN